jgi:hypothetical protein
LPACQVLPIKQRRNSFCGSRTGDREEKDHPARKRGPAKCHRMPRGLESRVGSSHQDVNDAGTTVVHCTQPHDAGASFSLIKPMGPFLASVSANCLPTGECCCTPGLAYALR